MRKQLFFIGLFVSFMVFISSGARADIFTDDFEDGIISHTWDVETGWGWATGLAFVEEGGCLKVSGTSASGQSNYWGSGHNGPYALTSDVEVSIKVMMPSIPNHAAMGYYFVGPKASFCLELHATNGYQLITTKITGEQVLHGNFPLKGNETTEYNLLKLTYTVATNTANAYVCDADGSNPQLLGTSVEDVGSQFGISLDLWIDSNTTVDARYDDFYLSADPYPTLSPPPLSTTMPMGEQQAFQPGADDLLFPVFSNNGTKMAYIHRDDPIPTNRIWNIYVKDLTSADPAYRVTEDSDWVAINPINWSPNGLRIYFFTQPPDSTSQIRYVDATETTNRISEAWLPSITDDCQSVDFSRSVNPKAVFVRNDMWGYNLYILDVDESGDPIEPVGNARRISNIFDGGLYWPKWSPDGTKIACGYAPFAGSAAIWIINDVDSIDPGTPIEDDTHPNVQTITPYSSNYAATPYFSYDGRFLFYCQDVNNVFNVGNTGWDRSNPIDVMLGNSDFDLFVASTDGSTPPERLKIAPYSQGIMSASPDGTLLVYITDDDTDLDGVRDADIYIQQLVVSEDIDMTGGELSDGSGTTVTIPAGALPQEETITIETPIPGSEPSLGGLSSGSSLVSAREFGPDGLTFDDPVTLEFHYTDEEVEGFDEKQLQIYSYDDIGGVWVAMDTLSHDMDNNIISTVTNHFSLFGILASGLDLYGGHFALVDDMSGGGINELAVLGLRDSDDVAIVQIKDAMTDAKVQNTWLTGKYPCKHIEILPDMNGTGNEELGVLASHWQTNGTVVQIKDAITRLKVNNVWYSKTYNWPMFRVVPNFAGTSAPEVAVLGSDTATNATIIQVKDAGSGFTLKNIYLSAAWNWNTFSVVPNFSDTPADELAALGVNPSTGAVVVLIKDASSATTVGHVNCDSNYPPIGMVVVPNITGSSTSAPEIAVLGRNPSTGDAKADVMDATDGALITAVNFSSDYRADMMTVVPDIAGSATAASELAIVGVRKSVGDMWVEVRDAGDGSLIGAWAVRAGNTTPNFSPGGLICVPDMNGDGVDELAVLCRNRSNGYAYVLVRDAEDGSVVNNIAYNRTFLPW